MGVAARFYYNSMPWYLEPEDPEYPPPPMVLDDQRSAAMMIIQCMVGPACNMAEKYKTDVSQVIVAKQVF
jgi:hypothetical protein